MIARLGLLRDLDCHSLRSGLRDQATLALRKQYLVELLQLGVSVRRISTQHLKYGYPSSLNYYIQTRKLRKEAGKR
jgi:hypothetical protein